MAMQHDKEGTQFFPEAMQRIVDQFHTRTMPLFGHVGGKEVFLVTGLEYRDDALLVRGIIPDDPEAQEVQRLLHTCAEKNVPVPIGVGGTIIQQHSPKKDQ
jgi:hypothetical protein